MQFFVALNHSYIVAHSLVEKGEQYQGKYLQSLEESKKSEALKKQLERELQALKKEKASIEAELEKVKSEAEELRSQLQESQDDLQTI